MATLKIRCLVPFQDLTIIPRLIKQNEELEVSDNVYQRLLSSGGKFELLGHVIPPSTSEVVEPPKKAKKNEPA
jgi:hypothetical protein